jgi:hypothetical protein
MYLPGVDPCRSITVSFRAIIARASSQTVPTSVTNLQNIIRGHSTRNATVPQQVNGVLISHHQCTARLDASFSVGNYIPEAKVHNTLGAAFYRQATVFPKHIQSLPATSLQQMFALWRSNYP